MDCRSRRTRFLVGGPLTAQMDPLGSRQEGFSRTSGSSSFKLRANSIRTVRKSRMSRTRMI